MEPHDTQYEYEEARTPIPLRQRPESGNCTGVFERQISGSLMLAGADVIPTKITDLEAAVLDLAGAMLKMTAYWKRIRQSHDAGINR